MENEEHSKGWIPLFKNPVHIPLYVFSQVFEVTAFKGSKVLKENLILSLSFQSYQVIKELIKRVCVSLQDT